MKNRSTMSKVITGTVAAAIVMSISTVTFAAGRYSMSGGMFNGMQNGMFNGMSNDMTDGMKSMHGSREGSKIKIQLDALVVVGSITQAQEEAVLKLVDVSDNNKDELITQLEALVTDGTLTEAQESIIEKLVAPSDNTDVNITTSSATTVQTDVYPGDNEKGFMSKLDALVTAGTITQAQEDDILNLFTNSDETQIQ